MSTTQQETTNPWAPNMIFNARRRLQDPAGLLEEFIERSATTFYRFYLRDTPNHDFSAMMAKATRYVIAIECFVQDASFRSDFFARLHNLTTRNPMIARIFTDSELLSLLRILDQAPNASLDQLAFARAHRLAHYYQYPDTLDQLVWAITHPEDAHPGVLADVDDRFFIAVLLIHHFKHHGGLVLPNLPAARAKESGHQTLIDSYKASGHSISELMMHYPNWRDSLLINRPPGLGGSPRVVTTQPANHSTNRSPNDQPQPDTPSRLSTIGEGRGRA